MALWPSIREYVSAVFRAYQSLVVGQIIALASAIGLFYADEASVRVLALIGVAMGFLIAPFQAFHRVRVERDTALNQNTLARMAWSYANALSGSSWSIQSFAAVNHPGLAVRAIVAADYRVPSEFGFDSRTMGRLRDALAVSTLEGWLQRRFVERGASAPRWELASPCDDYVITVTRGEVVAGGGGSNVYAKCTFQLPRSFSGVWPVLLVDVVARDVPDDPSLQPQNLGVPVPLAGEPYRPTLEEVNALLGLLAETVVEELAQWPRSSSAAGGSASWPGFV
jgi:hypothetical protein